VTGGFRAFWLLINIFHIIRGLSRFSTNIRSVSQVLTHALLSTTVYFSALTRARGTSHTTPNTGASGFSTNMRSMSTTLTDESLNTTESPSAVTHARSKSQTTPDTGCVKILEMWNLWVKPLQTHFGHYGRSLCRHGLVRSVNHTLLLIPGCVTILYKCEISESNPQMLCWTPQSLFQHWLVRVVNHTLLLLRGVRGVSRFSTNVRWVIQSLTHVLLSITESFLAVTRARSKSHTNPSMDVSRFSTNTWLVSQILTYALLSTTVYFSAVIVLRRTRGAPLKKGMRPSRKITRRACTHHER